MAVADDTTISVVVRAVVDDLVAGMAKAKTEVAGFGTASTSAVGATEKLSASQMTLEQKAAATAARMAEQNAVMTRAKQILTETAGAAGVLGTEEDTLAAKSLMASRGLEAAGLSGAAGITRMAGAFDALKVAALAGTGPLLAILAAIAVVAEGVKFFVDAAHEAGEFQSAMAVLGQTVKDQGGDWAMLSAEVKDFADAQARATSFSSDDVVTAMTKLTATGMHYADAQKVVRVSEDAAAATGHSLIDVSNALMEAMHGRTQALTELGIGTKESIKDGMTFNSVLAAIENQMGGAASAQATSFAGKLSLLGNAFGDLKRDIGDALLPAFGAIVDAIRVTVVGIDNAVEMIEQRFSAFLAHNKQVMAALEALWGGLEIDARAAFDGITAVITAFVDTAFSVLQSFIALLSGHWSNAWDDIRSIPNTAFKDMLSSFGSFGDDMVQVAIRIALRIQEAFSSIGSAMSLALSGNFSGAAAMLGTIPKTLMQGSFAEQFLPTISGSGKDDAWSRTFGGDGAADTDTGVNAEVGGRSGAKKKKKAKVVNAPRMLPVLTDIFSSPAQMMRIFNSPLMSNVFGKTQDASGLTNQIAQVQGRADVSKNQLAAVQGQAAIETAAGTMTPKKAAAYDEQEATIKKQIAAYDEQEAALKKSIAIIGEENAARTLELAKIKEFNTPNDKNAQAVTSAQKNLDTANVNLTKADNDLATAHIAVTKASDDLAVALAKAGTAATANLLAFVKGLASAIPGLEAQNKQDGGIGFSFNPLAMLLDAAKESKSYADIMKVVNAIMKVFAQIIDALRPVIDALLTVVEAIVNGFIDLWNIIARVISLFGIHIQQLEKINADLADSTPFVTIVHDIPTMNELASGNIGPLSAAGTNDTVMNQWDQPITNELQDPSLGGGILGVLGDILAALIALNVATTLFGGGGGGGIIGTITGIIGKVFGLTAGGTGASSAMVDAADGNGALAGGGANAASSSSLLGKVSSFLGQSIGGTTIATGLLAAVGGGLFGAAIGNLEGGASHEEGGAIGGAAGSVGGLLLGSGLAASGAALGATGLSLAGLALPLAALGPLGAIAGALLGGVVGGLFGGPTPNAQNNPDIVSTGTYGQEMADLQGSGVYDGKAAMNANGQSFTESSGVSSALGGEGEMQYIADYIKQTGGKGLTAQQIALFTGEDVQNTITGGKNGTLDLANGQSDYWSDLVTQAQSAIQTIAQSFAGLGTSVGGVVAGIGGNISSVAGNITRYIDASNNDLAGSITASSGAAAASAIGQVIAQAAPADSSGVGDTNVVANFSGDINGIDDITSVGQTLASILAKNRLKTYALARVS